MSQDNIKKYKENRAKSMRNAKTAAVLLAALLNIVGCSGNDNASNSAPGVTVRYIEAPPSLDVTAVNPYPLASADLVAPDGRYVRTDAIQRETLRSGGGSSIGFGGFGTSGGSFGTGVGIGFPLGGSSAAPGMIRSRAHLPIPDADEYRRDWQRMVVRLRFGTPPAELAVNDVLAPPPTPAATNPAAPAK